MPDYKTTEKTEALPSAIDPTCGMMVVAYPPTPALELAGVVRWFCNYGCREQYMVKLGLRVN